MSEYDTLLTEVADGVATVWLNRPEQRNAFNVVMLRELHRAFAAFEADDAVRAIVVTGAGGFFSVGSDLGGGKQSLSKASNGTDSHIDEAPEPWIKPWEMRTPIIAAINGSAVGVGLTLPMTWDIRIAARDAKCGFVFNRRGVIPEWGSLWLVPRLVGLSKCFDLILSGRLFDGQQALTRGLVTEALNAEDVLPAAQSLARDIAGATSPVSVGVTKRAVYQFLNEPDRDVAYERELEMFMWMTRQPDAVEGVQAFLEKRPPQWSSSKSGEHPPGT